MKTHLMLVLCQYAKLFIEFCFGQFNTLSKLEFVYFIIFTTKKLPYCTSILLLAHFLDQIMEAFIMLRL